MKNPGIQGELERDLETEPSSAELKGFLVWILVLDLSWTLIINILNFVVGPAQLSRQDAVTGVRDV